MRRVTLLALSVLALSMAASGDVLFAISSAQFTNGIVNRTFSTASGNFFAEAQGNVPSRLTIRTDGVTITSGCATTPGTCTFLSAGDVRVSSATMNVFMSDVTGGTITRSGDNVTIVADFAPNPMAPVGGFAEWTGKFCFVAGTCQTSPPPGANSIFPGTAEIVAVPEPGTLCLLGTSVIGLAGMVRRRLKLGDVIGI